MSKSDFQVTNYIDIIIGYSVCSKARDSFNYLYKLLIELGFDMNKKKVVFPAIKVTCLGVEINSGKFTVSVNQEKITDILNFAMIGGIKLIVQNENYNHYLVNYYTSQNV